MDLEKIKQWIDAGEIDAVESAWMDAIDRPIGPDRAGEVLAALVEAGSGDAAETLGWALLTEQADRLDAESALALGQAVLLAVPESEEIRAQAVTLYRAARGDRENFADLLEASGLAGGQAPRRAVRTLETCLALEPGTYLANRFDGRVVRVRRYDPALRDFEVSDAAGRQSALEPKALADEFESLDPSDFRVLRAERPDELPQAFQDDPQRVLLGLCIAHGGRIDSQRLKDEVVPEFVPKNKWSNWWNRARTAARRSEVLSVEGGRPTVIAYHPGGRSLEEELAADLDAARAPIDYLELLRTYLREARVRRQRLDGRFVSRLVAPLSERAARPDRGTALVAALALDEAAEKGVAAGQDRPAPRDVLSTAPDPAGALAGVTDADLFARGLEALRETPEVDASLERLLRVCNESKLPAVAAALADRGGDEALRQAAGEALAEPLKSLALCLWLWNEPRPPLSDPPSKLDLLARLFKALGALDHGWDVSPGFRKEARQRIRAALSAGDYASFREAIERMDESVAGVTRRRIERTDGLAQTVRDRMLDLLRQRFPAMFVQKRPEPAEDDSVLWTTAAALERRQDELRAIREESMPANARQIGEAAEQGDLTENADWQAAIEERDMLVARARRMQEELARARVISADDLPDGTVGVGSRVRLKRTDGTEVELDLLGPWDSDPQRRVYAYSSPLGRALLGRAPGETVELKLEGQPREYRVESVRPSPLLGGS